MDSVIYTTEEGTNFIFPKNLDGKKQTMTPEKAIELWNKVPKEIRSMAQKEIEFVDYYNADDSYWKKKYKNFTQSYATGGDKITFYRYEMEHSDDYVVRTYCHEAGHFIDTNIASREDRFSSENMWTEAIKEDMIKSNRRSPTSYGENSNSEDFAESVAEYVKNPSEFKKIYPNRASILKLVLNL